MPRPGPTVNAPPGRVPIAEESIRCNPTIPTRRRELVWKTERRVLGDWHPDGLDWVPTSSPGPGSPFGYSSAPSCLSLVSGGADIEPQGEEIDAIVLLGMTVTMGSYALLNVVLLRHGQDVGKRLVGIRIVRSDGTPASTGRLVGLRILVNWLLCIIPFYSLIDALMIFSDDQKCLHDRVADTIVVDV